MKQSVLLSVGFRFSIGSWIDDFTSLVLSSINDWF